MLFTYSFLIPKNRYIVVVDKVGDNVLSIISPHAGTDGNHIITGTGAMYDYERYSNLPPYKTWIDQYPCEHLSIEEGITHIGDYAFYNTQYYKSIVSRTQVSPSLSYTMG